jgi:hypothetical protein
MSRRSLRGWDRQTRNGDVVTNDQSEAPNTQGSLGLRQVGRDGDSGLGVSEETQKDSG